MDSQYQGSAMYKVLLILLLIQIISIHAILPVCPRYCPQIQCVPGYAPRRIGCCNQCVKVENECETNCEGRICPIIDCREGYVPVKSDCSCCDVCKPIKSTS
ncbi:uncharacterized protein DDB_G0274171 [Parasteatoda tepidariorum]|uniref:uncharacterized protein DDB_G0274171 n=1 Tax=Parasteatoda tepidariorum TaxID=114398 RepID=UPI00077F96F7